MKRIQPTGCGYNTYICSGLPAITSGFREGSTAIPMPIVSGGTFVYDKSAIPQQLEGFVMTLTPVIDMDTTELEIPELECRTEFNPFEISGDTVYKNAGADYTGLESNNHDGFLDFYLNGGTIGMPITAESKTYKEAVYIRVDGATTPVYVPDSENPYILGGTCTFTDQQVVGPGILEPMVDTDFSPITIDTIPPQDAYFDTTTYLFDIFDAWRELVDNRLNNMHDYVIPYDDSSANGILNLLNESNRDGLCTNFKIQQINPDVPVIGITGATSALPQYEVGPGKITIDGVVYTITESDMGEPPFDAYLDIRASTVTAGRYVPIIVKNLPATPHSQHLKYVYIGSVKEVTGSTAFPYDGSSYRLYEIHQGDCILDLNLTGGTSTGPCGYNGPFKVIADGSTVTVVCPDCPREAQNEEVAGYYSVNGSTYTTVGKLTKTLPDPVYIWTDVYLIISGPTSGRLSFTPSTANNEYNVFLARVINGSTTAQVQYGAIHVDGRWS